MKPEDPLNLYMHFEASLSDSSSSVSVNNIDIIRQLKAKSQTLEFEKETGSIPTEAPSLCSSKQCESSTLGEIVDDVASNHAHVRDNFGQDHHAATKSTKFTTEVSNFTVTMFFLLFAYIRPSW